MIRVLDCGSANLSSWLDQPSRAITIENVTIKIQGPDIEWEIIDNSYVGYNSLHCHMSRATMQKIVDMWNREVYTNKTEKVVLSFEPGAGALIIKECPDYIKIEVEE